MIVVLNIIIVRCYLPYLDLDDRRYQYTYVYMGMYSFWTGIELLLAQTLVNMHLNKIYSIP